MDRDALFAAVQRFAVSVVETGIVFAAAAVVAAVANADVSAREIGYAAAIAFTKGVVEGCARYLRALKDPEPAHG